VGDDPVAVHGSVRSVRIPGPDYGAIGALAARVVALVIDNVLEVVALVLAGLCGALLAFWIWQRGGPRDPPE
jgi:hypothetical protein